MTRVIDFDAFRAEQKQEPITLRIGGQDFELPAFVPASAAMDLVRLREEMGDNAEIPADRLMSIAIELLGGKARFEALTSATNLGLDELPALVRMVMEAYQDRLPDPQTRQEKATV